MALKRYIQLGTGASILLMTACVSIEPGEVGVLVDKCSGGGINSKTLSIGYHYVSPFCEDVQEYKTTVQTYNTEVHSPTKDGLDVTSEVSISYQVEAVKAPDIWGKFKTDVETIEKTYIDRRIKESMRAQFSQFGGEEIYTKQSVIRSNVEGELRKVLQEEGFSVQAFSINKTTLPQSVVDAIQTKVTMTQKAQAAENELQRTRALAQQEVAKARGEAEAKLIRAEAESKYIKTVTESLTPAFVQYVKAQKWDGKLPKVTGGNSLIDLREKE